MAQEPQDAQQRTTQSATVHQPDVTDRRRQTQLLRQRGEQARFAAYLYSNCEKNRELQFHSNSSPKAESPANFEY
jgi:hypothetical protein